MSVEIGDLYYHRAVCMESWPEELPPKVRKGRKCWGHVEWYALRPKKDRRLDCPICKDVP